MFYITLNLTLITSVWAIGVLLVFFFQWINGWSEGRVRFRRSLAWPIYFLALLLDFELNDNNGL